MQRGAGTIRTGIGGWVYPPWRGRFYPPGLPRKAELSHAAARLGAIEINATHYRLQPRARFAAWRDATPKGFRFTVKAWRACTARRTLADAGEAVAAFLDQGIAVLEDRLGPILWQLPPTKAFEADDVARFLDLLPETLDGRRLHHAVEPRHASFACPAFIAMMRARGLGVVVADHPDFPHIAAPTAPFVYARLMRADAAEPHGYPAAGIADWAARARDWAAGAEPRDVYLFAINGAKQCAPAVALALAGRIAGQG